jgi:hypothetical protein
MKKIAVVIGLVFIATTVYGRGGGSFSSGGSRSFSSSRSSSKSTSKSTTTKSTTQSKTTVKEKATTTRPNYYNRVIIIENRAYDPFPTYLVWYFILFHNHNYSERRTAEAKQRALDEHNTQEYENPKPSTDWLLWINIIGLLILLGGIGVGSYFLIRRWEREHTLDR